MGKAGGANLDWNNLGFEFRPTKSHIKFVWKNGQWDQVCEKRRGGGEGAGAGAGVVGCVGRDTRTQ